MRTLTISAVLFVLCLSTVEGTEYMSVDEVKPGMKGVGKTVLRDGDRVEEFLVEVIGVMKNVAPDTDMVLVKCSGARLEKTGIIAGMSGSPIYINGKLLGALAFAWPFAKEPIAGVQPIEQMVNPSRLGETAAVASEGSATASLKRLTVPLVVSGLPEELLPVLEKRFRRYGLMTVNGGKVAGGKPPRSAGRLKPGGAVAVQLVSGDMDLSAVGTVTDVTPDGRVYAFGHPFLAEGHVQYPMAMAYVHGVMPSNYLSFKLASVGRVVGSIYLDHSRAVVGRIGEKPDTIPVSVKVKRGDMGEKTFRSYHFEFARLENGRLMRILAWFAISGSLYIPGNLPPVSMVSCSVKLETNANPPISYAFTVPSDEFMGGLELTELLPMMVEGRQFNVKLERMSFSVEVRAGRKDALISGVSLPVPTAQPGESIPLRVHLRPYRRATVTVDYTITIPDDIAPGVYEMTVCDAFEDRMIMLSNRPHLRYPENFEQLRKALSIPQQNRLYVRIKGETSGVSLGGVEIPDTPFLAAAAIADAESSYTRPLKQDYRFQLPCKWFPRGRVTTRIRVTRKEEGR